MRVDSHFQKIIPIFLAKADQAIQREFLDIVELK